MDDTLYQMTAIELLPCSQTEAVRLSELLDIGTSGLQATFFENLDGQGPGVLLASDTGANLDELDDAGLFIGALLQKTNLAWLELSWSEHDPKTRLAGADGGRIRILADGSLLEPDRVWDTPK